MGFFRDLRSIYMRTKIFVLLCHVTVTSATCLRARHACTLFEWMIDDDDDDGGGALVVGATVLLHCMFAVSEGNSVYVSRTGWP